MDKESTNINLAASRIAKPISLPLRKTSSTTASTTSLASVKSVVDSPEVLTANTDDFIIGDRVFVNGSKPGYIQYIGETQFAPGEWAGVVLDEPVGKNDGSVAGVRYFQCESKRGVFARLHRITRLPMSLNGSTPTSASKTMVATRLSNTTSPSESVKSANITSPSTRSTATTTTTTTLSPGIRIGDRVIVSSSSGVKNGILKFLGPTSFAPGNWAGVELDEPVGKNDGSVAGKRYFDCEEKHGLFAPLHKITRLGASKALSTTVSTKVVSSGNSPLHRRAGSQESLNSSMSSASSLVRPGKVRLGVKALTTNTQKATRPAALNTSTSSSALQVALKEKVEHIEQLLKERDIERSEVARAAAQKEEAEQKVFNLQVERQRLTEANTQLQNSLQEKMRTLEMEKNDLVLSLEDERKKVEDLQFRIEEEEIAKSELENECREGENKICQLESILQKQKMSSTTEPEKLIEADAILTTYKESIEVLSSKVSQLEETVKKQEFKEFDTNEKLNILESGLMTKEESILQLESNLAKRNGEINNLQILLVENKTELEKVKERQSRQLETIDNLNLELNKRETVSTTLQEGLQKLKVENADLLQQITSYKGNQEHLLCQNAELEKQILQVMQTTGDNSEQLLRMNDDLREKETLVDDLRKQLSQKSQELVEQIDILEHLKEQFIVERIKASDMHSEKIVLPSQTIEFKEAEIVNLKSELKFLNEGLNDLENKKKEMGSEICELTVKQVKQEAEINYLNVKLQETILQLDVTKQNSDKQCEDLKAQLAHTVMEKEILQNEKEECLRQRLSAEEGLIKYREEIKQISHEKHLSDLAVIERDAQTVALKSETERLQSAFAQHKDDLKRKLSETELVTKTMNELQIQLHQLNELEDQVKILECEKQNLIEELSAVKDSKVENEQNISTNKVQYNAEMIQKLEEEKQQLENKVVELQVSVARSQGNANSPDSILQDLKVEKESLIGQIEFLNSVIVDMQRKNDELSSKIKILENGEHIETTDFNLNGIKTLVAPRLFCDICDRFDVHDTEDCPTQSSADENLHSQHHGKRNAERPYCTNCEVFGHSNDNCDDNEMF